MNGSSSDVKPLLPRRLLRLLPSSWMGAEVTTESHPGGLYLLKGVGGDHIRVARGAFREVIPEHRLPYTFGWERVAKRCRNAEFEQKLAEVLCVRQR
jgi:uncharacterized protein YndB with AHSA1/START domain